MSQGELPDHEVSEKPSMIQNMVVVFILVLFETLPALKALKLVLDGVDRGSFPYHIRDDFGKLRSELERVLEDSFEFLVDRLVDNVHKLLDSYIDDEALWYLKGYRT